MQNETFLTPFEFAATQALSRRLFRKKVLPVSSIDYNGRKIEFSKDYLIKMVDAFDDGAFDNVPLQFADAQNQHTNDPDRYRGDVVAMSLENDGLYVTVAATPEGAKVLEENPKLGISARIINNYDRSDSKHYDAAVQHVLATHDPRIPGLGAWENVENYSNNSEHAIIDLSDEKFAKPEKQKKEKSVADNKLTDTELEALRALLSKSETQTEEDNSDELTDDELNALLAEVDAELEAEAGTEADDNELVDAGAELSNSKLEALELARKSDALELAQVRDELDEQRWSNERVMFAKDYGIPPSIVDLAKPVLKGAKNVVELSNGKTVDAGAIMREVFTELGKQIKLLDLSNELGSGLEGDTSKADEAKARAERTTALRSELGI